MKAGDILVAEGEMEGESNIIVVNVISGHRDQVAAEDHRTLHSLSLLIEPEAEKDTYFILTPKKSFGHTVEMHSMLLSGY